MRIFASWSGEPSRQVAELIRAWLPYVIQEADVWVSSQDIEKGQRWLSAVGDRLSEIHFGIVVVTPSNITAPWLMFEAGALSKSLESRVTALLCEVDRKDIAGTPLFQFQNTLVNEKEMLSLVRMINELSSSALPGERIDTTFERFWPDFFKPFSDIDFAIAKNADAANEAERLEKIETVLEGLARSIQRLERNTENSVLRTPLQVHSPVVMGQSGAIDWRSEQSKLIDEQIKKRILRNKLQHGEILIEDAEEK